MGAPVGGDVVANFGKETQLVVKKAARPRSWVVLDVRRHLTGDHTLAQSKHEKAEKPRRRPARPLLCVVTVPTSTRLFPTNIRYSTTCRMHGMFFACPNVLYG